MCPPQDQEKAEETPEEGAEKAEEALVLCGGRELVNVRQLDFSVMYFYTLYLFIMKCSGGVF